MRETTLKLWQVGALAGTRAMLGGGVALMLSDRLTPQRRRQAGWILFSIGAASTLPLAMAVRRNSCAVRVGRVPLINRRRRRWCL